jgi:hypothetical protein
MKKIANLIQKSNQIKDKFSNMIRGDKDENEDRKHGKIKNHRRDDDELDDHNDPKNWSYC